MKWSFCGNTVIFHLRCFNSHETCSIFCITISRITSLSSVKELANQMDMHKPLLAPHSASLAKELVWTVSCISIRNLGHTAYLYWHSSTIQGLGWYRSGEERIGYGRISHDPTHPQSFDLVDQTWQRSTISWKYDSLMHLADGASWSFWNQSKP